MALSPFVVTAFVTVAWPGTWSEVVNGPVGPAVVTPAVPSSTVAQYNPNPFG